MKTFTLNLDFAGGDQFTHAPVKTVRKFTHVHDLSSHSDFKTNASLIFNFMLQQVSNKGGNNLVQLQRGLRLQQNTQKRFVLDGAKHKSKSFTGLFRVKEGDRAAVCLGLVLVLTLRCGTVLVV